MEKTDPASTFWFKFYRNIYGIFRLTKINNKTEGLQQLRVVDAYILYSLSHENNAEFDRKVQDNKHIKCFGQESTINELNMLIYACILKLCRLSLIFSRFDHIWQNHNVCLINLEEKKTMGNSVSDHYPNNRCTHWTQIWFMEVSYITTCWICFRSDDFCNSNSTELRKKNGKFTLRPLSTSTVAHISTQIWYMDMS